jgi:C1A family cysteine protease
MNILNRKYSCLQLLTTCIFVTLAFTAAAQEDNKFEVEPYGPPGTALPSGATMIDKAQFLQLLNQGGLRLTTLHQGERDDERREERHRDLENLVKRYLREHPELTNLAQLVTNDPEPGPGIQPRGDGTWLLLLPSVERSVVTLGRAEKLNGIYNSILFSTDRAANLNLYTQVYNNLPGGYLESIDTPPPTPVQLANSNLSQIQASIAALGHDWQAIVGHVSHQFPIPALGCQAETGAGIFNLQQGDRAGNLDYCSPSAAGIYANFDFPNKSYNTCVKSQGSRGTCHSFAITSATELQISMKHNVKVNLSEQDLMEHYRLLWQPALQQESGDPLEEANDIITNNYFQPYEYNWDYNPALLEYVSKGALTNTCSDYVTGEPCSNTAPEAPQVCASFRVRQLSCGYRDAQIPHGPYQISSVTSFWDPSDAEKSTEMTILSLAFNNSVVLSLSLSPGFQGAAGGYVPYTPADLAAPSVGSHIIHVIGFIGNDELLQKLPKAPPAAGAGYFIVKNSWSNCVGDGGYYYLPWNYVRDRVTNGFSITGVN